MATRTCGACGDRLGAAVRAQAKFCSAACKQRAYRMRSGSKIPAGLRSRPQWVTWRYVVKNGEATKVPFQADGRAASSTDPATWSRYGAVRGMQRKGFVLESGIVCVDLDGCLEDGKVADWARRIVAAAPATYIEVSPSGTGLHLFGLGDVAKGRRIRRGGEQIEVYSSGRYICVTGDRFEQAPGSLADLTDFIDHLIA